MATDRMRQINELLKVELAREFSRNVELPTGTVVSITNVRTSKDLHYATVNLSIMPAEAISPAMRVIKKQLPHIVDGLRERVVIRHMPRFRFIYDGTEEKADRIERLLDSIQETE